MAKNPYGKTVTADKAYAVYKDSRMPGWTWYVLKTYQTPEKAAKNPYARAFAKVVSPMTGPSGDLGDVYLSDLGDTLVSGVDVRAGTNRVLARLDRDRPEPGKVYALTGPGPSIAKGNTWAESEVQDDERYAFDGGARADAYFEEMAERAEEGGLP